MKSMNKRELIGAIQSKKSILCVGLDTDLDRIPAFLQKEFKHPVVEFNRRIIESTRTYAVAYKFNVAFYEAMGAYGWECLERSLEFVPAGIFTIADAKRGDIGNTSGMYARTFFETLNFDAITVSPYMGRDSLEPFYSYHDKWVIILGLTSNRGSGDVQMLRTIDGRYVFEETIERMSTIGGEDNTMFVVGATQPGYLSAIRQIIPNHFLLIPGIGAQGGNLEATISHGRTEDIGLMINSSRGIIYAGDGKGFADEAARAAHDLHRAINGQLQFYG